MSKKTGTTRTPTASAAGEKAANPAPAVSEKVADAPSPAPTPTRLAKKKSATRRTKLPDRERLLVWVRAGGTCVLCKRYLLDGSLTGLPVSLGELAHIVGQQDSDRSPRGRHWLARHKRDLAENVLLACESCHEEIDDQLATGILDVDALTRIKALHEQRIRHVVTLPDDRRSLVLRMVAELRGNALEIGRDTAATAVISADRFPWFDLDRNHIGVEIDLRNLPDEAEADQEYYASARRAIDRVLEHKLHDAVNSGDVKHVSVFPFARLPLLVYLGSRLEDNYAVDVFQRHRNTQSWAWQDTAPHQFTVAGIEALNGADEAVLLLSVSGTVDPAEVPVELRHLPRVTVNPDATPSPDIVTSRGSLDEFTKAVRAINAAFDANTRLRTVHVFGALPPTAAVELGRLLDRHIHPALVIYDRSDAGTYRPAVEIS